MKLINLKNLYPGNREHITAYLQLHHLTPIYWFNKKEVLCKYDPNSHSTPIS